MEPTILNLPQLAADLILIHPPAFYDFRNRDDIYFPFLGTSGDVPITPLYDYFPIGFKSIQQILQENNYEVKIINLVTLLLKYPFIDLKYVFQKISAKIFGIDLHWMVHVQGSLAIAQILKNVHPEIPIIFGGISSTYFAKELINYPFIDMVMRGHATELPLLELLKNIDKNTLEVVPNLVWKTEQGNIRFNKLNYTPDYLDTKIKWTNISRMAKNHTLPISEIITTQIAGCNYNCGWCGGSHYAYCNLLNKKNIMMKKKQNIQYEIDSLKKIPSIEKYHLYTVGSYNEKPDDFDFFLDLLSELPVKSVSYEQFFLTPSDLLKKMVRVNRRTIITLSPESHDQKISKLAGRGVYSNEELENWINNAMSIGISQIDIWYFIGMPEQDKYSIEKNIEYCNHLLEKFRGLRVNPMICPMIPFLDPGSKFFNNPSQYGYKVFYRTVEQHRRGMENASIINRLNYETKWLSRREIVLEGLRAIRELMQIKGKLKIFPEKVIDNYVKLADDAINFIKVVDSVDNIKDKAQRRIELGYLADEIKRRNDMIFYSGVTNQAFPIQREIGGRWFDEIGWDLNNFESA